MYGIYLVLHRTVNKMPMAWHKNVYLYLIYQQQLSYYMLRVLMPTFELLFVSSGNVLFFFFVGIDRIVASQHIFDFCNVIENIFK